MGSNNFPAIAGIKIVDGKVTTSGSRSRPLGRGPLAGGSAEIWPGAPSQGQGDSSSSGAARVTETLAATDATVPAAAGQGRSRDRAVTELYALHYRALVRLAVLLVRDVPTAEDIVQDSFVALHDGWQRLRDSESAPAHLRSAVLNRCRSVLRHRAVIGKHPQKPPPDMPSAEHGMLVLAERSAVLAALRKLTDRQREAIVLRYYADFSEAEIAAAMGISRGAVKNHTARGMAALRAEMEQPDRGVEALTPASADDLPLRRGRLATALQRLPGRVMPKVTFRPFQTRHPGLRCRMRHKWITVTARRHDAFVVAGRLLPSSPAGPPGRARAASRPPGCSRCSTPRSARCPGRPSGNRTVPRGPAPVPAGQPGTVPVRRTRTSRLRSARRWPEARGWRAGRRR
jgi:RNA polymerase sigma-70 factor (sigma-E family)